MKIYIVIPAYNEASFIGQTIQSLVDQTLRPEKLVIVNDNSSDETARIVSALAEKFSFISLISTTSAEEEHSPGSKVIKAFNEGLKTLDLNYDIICKFDADLIFPENYLEVISEHFQKNSQIGMVGGFCTIEKDGKWVKENLTGKDHIRGALKAYRKECFFQIGKLKCAMGWDTADELIAQYYGWKITTVEELRVKHLKPTGASYTERSGHRQGESFYRLRYGLPITLIASAKLAFLKKDLSMFFDYLNGYRKAKKENQPFLVSEDEGRFIRRLRWQKIKGKFL